MTPETTEQELAGLFANLKLTTAGAPKFFLNPLGVSKGCALVPFGTPEEAKAAVTALEGAELAGQKLRARADKGPRRNLHQKQVNADQSYVYVGNLDPAVTSQELEDLFAPFGKTQYVSISRKRRSENSLGWATVQLGSEEEAQKAQQSLNGQAFKGRELTVEPLKSMPRKARARKEREPRDPTLPALENAEPEPVDPCVVWVGNLDWGTSEDQLRQLFQQHGEVKEAVMTRQRRSNRARGWGTVTFATPEQAAAAVTALNGFEFGEGEQKQAIEVQIRRGARRRRRAPRETNEEAGTTERPRRGRRQRRPRTQNTDEEPRAKPRRNEKQAEPAAEGGEKPKRRARARKRRNDSQRNDDNAPAEQNAETEGKTSRRRRKPRKPDGEGEATTGEQPERRAPQIKTVDFPDRHLHIRNLAWSVTNDDLKNFFATAGTVVNAEVTKNAKGTSRGWGTVEMGSAAEATKALELDKQPLNDRPLSVRLDRNVAGRE